MRRLFGLTLLASANFAYGSVPASLQARSIDSVFYELYSIGDETTDQASTASGTRSSLIGTVLDDADIQDDDFATNVAGPALKAGASLFYSFGQCYSGGLIDDLAALGGVQAIVTSARHSETASYAYEPPEGTDVDYTDAFITAMGDGHVTTETIAKLTAANDPFGPNPNIPRISEPMGSEHTQFFATTEGAKLKLAEQAASGMAVLWAGQPAERDGVQMNLMIERLVSMGFTRDKIWLMYGGGEADAEHPVVRNQIIGKKTPVNLLAATRSQLVELFKTTFEPSPGKATPKFVFFYVGDHGGLNGKAVAKLNFESADMLVTPNLQAAPGIHLYGEGLKARK